VKIKLGTVRLTTRPTRRFTYDARGRLVQTQVDGRQIEYGINALGQRVFKREGAAANASATVFHYDLSGRLIAETDAAGAAIREHVYLDSLPVALVAKPASPASPAPILIDNPQAAFTGIWPPVTTPTGFEGADYQTHAPHPGVTGSAQ
jgi:YD repeat-containing protein